MRTTALLCAALALAAGAHAQTRIVKVANGWQLQRNGKPYFIRGAGGARNLELLAASGGNSIRTWGADAAGGLLDKAQSLKLSVTVGIWLGHKEHGFRYDDAAKVAEQHAASLAHVSRYKDHPALLCWSLGNEMENGFEGDDVWKAVEALAADVKRLDPNHPVMTVVAEVSQDKIDKIKRLCPSLDLLGINTYGGASTLAERLKTFGWDRPYVVTEFGPLGPWEVGKTSWGAAIDMTSTQKGETYRNHYQKAIVAGGARCLGGYAFLWDDKVEGTATWFGMFLPQTGERLAPADTLIQLWSGKPPKNRAPELLSLESAAGGKEIGGGESLSATWSVRDPERDRLSVRWEIRREDGGFVDEGPGSLTGATLNAPKAAGAYRLFVTVRDGKGGAATGNIPFRVRG